MSDLPIRPPLSVVVASTQPWPEVRGCLEAVLPQVQRLGAELIVVDGDGRGLPDPGAGHDPRDSGAIGRADNLIWLRRPGLSPYQLRAVGMSEARGDIVAVTEDHCRPRPDWCAEVLAAHHRWPDAAVIGGAVENGATFRWLDWAQFFVPNASFLLPLPTGPRAEVSGQANVSYKRAALPDGYPDIGVIEADLHRTLRAQGATLVSDPHMIVDHVQSLGLAGTLAINFHNGRCQRGFCRPDDAGVRRRALVRDALRVPLRLLRDPVRLFLRIAVRKGRLRREALLAWPFVPPILAAHMAGELVGLVAGPGGSPLEMR